MRDTTYKLGINSIASIAWNGCVKLRIRGHRKNAFIYQLQPHELRKLAQAIEDHNLLRDLGEDSNHIS